MKRPVFVRQTKGCPCGECETRKLGCHSSCEPYLSWKAKVDEAREKAVKQNRNEHMVEEYILDQKIKSKNRKPKYKGDQ